MGGTGSMNGKMENAHKIVVRKLEEKRSTVRPRRRWEDNSVTCTLWVNRVFVYNRC
jgi:hypothetical protein